MESLNNAMNKGFQHQNTIDSAVRSQTKRDKVDLAQVSIKAAAAANRKRKLEEDLDALVDGVKRLRCKEPSPWEAMGDMRWNDRSGKLYGKWDFGDSA